MLLFMLNLIDKPSAFYWLELSFDIPKYLYALSNLTWTLIRVHKNYVTQDSLIASSTF